MRKFKDEKEYNERRFNKNFFRDLPFMKGIIKIFNPQKTLIQYKKKEEQKHGEENNS
jgi:hypothetical protein